MEGDPAYSGGGFAEKTHIQIAVCDASCIKGVFRVQGLFVPSGGKRKRARTSRPDSHAPQIVHETFGVSFGRTVGFASIFATTARGRRHVHHDETLTVEFDDGSRLVVQGGSNGGNLMDEIPGFNASDLSLSYVPTFYEPGKRDPTRKASTNEA